jgi:hypothetical protein
MAYWACSIFDSFTQDASIGWFPFHLTKYSHSRAIVIKLGYETFQDLINKENDSTSVGFQELLEDYVLIHEGIIMAILLKRLVP